MSTVRAYQSGISDKSDAAFRPAFVNLSLSHVSELLVYGQSKVFTGIVVIVLAIYLFRATESAGRFLEFFYSSPDALDFHGKLLLSGLGHQGENNWRQFRFRSVDPTAYSSHNPDIFVLESTRHK